jgi:DNA polymerase-1
MNLLLVDGNNLLYRAYHAFPKELTGPKGEPINAVYGFARILLTSIKTLKPDCVAVCFDLKGPTFRHTQYDGYKAQREAMPEDLAAQIDRIHEIVEKLEFALYAQEGFEADDIIGTLARQAAHQGATVTILTGDKDMLQLVTCLLYTSDAADDM